MSLEELQLRMVTQAERCMICQDPITLATCHVDHNHSTGEVRGLLCRQCNHYLHIIETKGNWWVMRAFQYLRGEFDFKYKIEAEK